MKKLNIFRLLSTVAIAAAGVFGIANVKEAPKSNIAEAGATIDIYFSRPKSGYDDAWHQSTPDIYYAALTWPGTPMTYSYTNGSGESVYKASIPSGTTMIIFSSLKQGQWRDQTVDIKTNIANNKGFYLTGGSWGSRTVGSWDVQFYTLAFDANGGSGEMTSHNAVRDINWGVPSCTFTRTGYEFTGWNTKANGSGTSYSAGSSIAKNSQAANSTLTLYAQWREIEYRIVGSAKGNWSPSSSGAIKFTSYASNKYKAEGLTFVANETWKVIKDTSGWVNSGYNGNTAIFNSFMTMDGTNVKVTSAGAAYTYSVYITVDSSYSVTEVWVAFFYNAEKFCTLLMSSTNGICSNSTQGQNASLLKPVWDSLYGQLSNYPDSEIQKMRDATANESGSEIEIAMARYDRICQLYGTALEQSPKTYDYNFLNRSSATHSGSNLILWQTVNKTSSTIAVLVIISVVSVGAIGGYFFIRKRKENN